MLSIVTSRYTAPAQLAFIATNILGLLAALSYNARTPDLYPNNAHHKIGWIITNIVTVQVVMGIMARRQPYHTTLSPREQIIEPSFMPLRMTADDEHSIGVPQGPRHYSDRDHETSIELLEPQSRISDTTEVEPGTEGIELPAMTKCVGSNSTGRNRFLSAPIHWLRNISKALGSKNVWEYIVLGYKVTDRIILPLGFITLATGVVATGRFFVR